MRCYLCEFEINVPSGLQAIVACPNCKRNIITDGSDSEEIGRLKGQILALTLVNKSQDETINIWKNQVNEDKIIKEKLNDRINQLLSSKGDLGHRSYNEFGSVQDLESELEELKSENTDLREQIHYLQAQLENKSWDSHI
jgi:chromosome segregation ATPase